MEPRLTGVPVPKPKVAPRTIVVSKLLALSSLELEQAVLNELSENPALDLDERQYCSRCGAIFSGSVCPSCEGATERTEVATPEPDWSAPIVATSPPEEDWDPFSRVAAPHSIRDHLLWQLSAQVSASDLEVASLLLENLDHRGLIDCELEAVSSAAGVPVDRVEQVLSLIQRQDPVGIGARTVEECLLVQLESLGNEDEVVKLSEQLIQEHWEALGKGRVEAIAKALDVDVDDVLQARNFMRANLYPYPIHTFVEGAGSADHPVEAYYIRPDVIITIRGGPGEEEFDIEFPEERRFRLRVHRSYRELLRSLGEEQLDSIGDEYEHVRQYVARCKLFIYGWQDRWRTLRSVVEALLDYQREFVLSGVEELRPLTRGQLADLVGVHESTVSRAVASKYAQLPDGELVALADFFDGSLRAKALIKDLVSQESRALTDGELAELLAESGISIARRTVAKYRQALGILPAGLR